jgi:NAD-dependent SIR2 family protein deacetylase
MNAELLHAHRTDKLMLFVGAGVSANLDLPTYLPTYLERADSAHC